MAINPFFATQLFLSAASQVGHRGWREAGVSALVAVTGEEQHFPSSLPEPFSHVLQSSKKTQEENGELFFQCIPLATEPHTLPLPGHPPRRCFPTPGSLFGDSHHRHPVPARPLVSHPCERAWAVLS